MAHFLTGMSQRGTTSTMIVRYKLSVLLLIVGFQLACCEDTTDIKDDLMESESKDPAKVEIIKQIKRVNDDGSYTFGYEADDGTFKIESRDVLGNIKGTFGFVNADGEIKRVSYTTTNTTESATVSSVEKERSSVIQQIPRNRTIISSTTRRPPNIVFPHVTPSPSSTVIQSIPKRRAQSIVASSNNNLTTTSTEGPSYKNVVKATDFDISTTRSSSTTESPARTSQQPRPTGHYIRSTLSPQDNVPRYTEGQLIRPTQADTVTPRPTENIYSRRLIVTRNPYLEEPLSSTIKPIVEESEFHENMRSNLLRRQLNQEKVSNFDTRQHVLNLQQSIGDDSTDVYSGSLTTGTPRHLFTTTDRPRPLHTIISAAKTNKYQPVYQTNAIRGPQPTPASVYRQETTTDATNTENNYAQPNPVLHLQNQEQQVIPVMRSSHHPFHRGAILIPVNQIQNGRYIIEDPNEEVNQQQFVPQFTVPNQQLYLRETNQNIPQQIPDPRLAPVPYQIIPRRRPVQVQVPVQVEQMENVYSPRPYRVPLPINPAEFQDEIDNIKPPVSTQDFQKLLNRLIMRQTQLQEISRLENTRMLQETYINPERYRQSVQPTPVSVFVRARQDRLNNGPVQFISQPQAQGARHFITVPQSPQVPMQKLMESQQQYSATDPYSENYAPPPLFRPGRRVARLLQPGQRPKQEEDNYLPPDVREMLLLRMLQLAINPNLPLQPSEGETMASAIRNHKKESVRNVEILGEEQEQKPVSRNKRFRESVEYDYY
ncbi:Cuticular protein 97Ea [Carabus blaptoides fortunei]